MPISSNVAKKRPSNSKGLLVENHEIGTFQKQQLQQPRQDRDEESLLPIDDILDEIALHPPASSGVSAITMWTKASRWTRSDKSDAQTYFSYTTDQTPSVTSYTEASTSPLPDDGYKMDLCQRFFGHPMFSNLNAILFVILLGLVHYVHSGF